MLHASISYKTNRIEWFIVFNIRKYKQKRQSADSG